MAWVCHPPAFLLPGQRSLVAPLPPFPDSWMTETQERFLRTVLTRIPLDGVVELHLFPPIRRGTMETGVAVIAMLPPAAPLTVVEVAPVEEAPVEEAPVEAMLDETVLDETALDETVLDETVLDSAILDGAVVVPRPPLRLRILTAGYRHTIKGIDRGKWSVDVQEEADAPLEAVEAVLRGVRQRSPEPADPELVSLDALAALLVPARVAPAA